MDRPGSCPQARDARPERPGLNVDPIEIGAEELDQAQNVISHPMIWFINHRLWDLATAPDIRREELEAWHGYKQLSEAAATAALRRIVSARSPLVLTYGYQLLLAARRIRVERSDARLVQFVPTAWGDPEDWTVLPQEIQEELFRAMLANDVIAFPALRHARAFIRCCDELFDLECDARIGLVRHEGREISVLGLPLAVDAYALDRLGAIDQVVAVEEQLLASRRQYTILMVSDADLSRNLLRSMSAFDLFLEQHPAYRSLVSFEVVAFPVHTEVPQNAEYLEAIEAIIAVVNHRHGSTDWMPVTLALEPEAAAIAARLKLSDLLICLALSQGADLVLEASAVLNQRNGVVILSTGSGSYEHHRDDVLAVHPFNIQALVDRMHEALSMSTGQRSEIAGKLRDRATRRVAEDWLAALLEKPFAVAAQGSQAPTPSSATS